MQNPHPEIPTPNVYICFAYSDTSGEADLSHIGRQLKLLNLDAEFECVHLAPGVNLWDRISARIRSSYTAAWCYVLTPELLDNRACRDGLIAALDRAVQERGARFPVAGLLYRTVAAHSLPLPLRVRPCIHLADPDWREQLQAIVSRARTVESEFVWTVHRSYGGEEAKTAVEVHPRSEIVNCWRFAVPRSSHPIRWGHGAPGGGEISTVRFSAVRGAGQLENIDMHWFGSEDTLSPTESAYVVFEGQLPDFVCFGRAQSRSGGPAKMEIFPLRRNSG